MEKKEKKNEILTRTILKDVGEKDFKEEIELGNVFLRKNEAILKRLVGEMRILKPQARLMCLAEMFALMSESSGLSPFILLSVLENLKVVISRNIPTFEVVKKEANYVG